jgi:hypothetical protein
MEQLFTLYTLAPHEVDKILALSRILIKDRGALFDYFYQQIRKEKTIRNYVKNFFFDVKQNVKIELSGYFIETVEIMPINEELYSVVVLKKDIQYWPNFLKLLDKLLHLAYQGKWTFPQSLEALAAWNASPLLFRN